jgi:hypothetical protein
MSRVRLKSVKDIDNPIALGLCSSREVPDSRGPPSLFLSGVPRFSHKRSKGSFFEGERQARR